MKIMARHAPVGRQPGRVALSALFHGGEILDRRAINPGIDRPGDIQGVVDGKITWRISLGL